MLVAAVALSACSSDDEPAVLESVAADGSSFPLNEAGEVSLQFTVTPADALISNATLVAGTEAFEVGDLTSACLLYTSLQWLQTISLQPVLKKLSEDSQWAAQSG